MQQVSRLEYAFAVGKVRALEKFLIGREAFLEAIDEDVPEALRLFAEAGRYGSDLQAARSSAELEEALGSERRAVQEGMCALLPDEGLRALVQEGGLDESLAAVRRYGSPVLTTYVMHAVDMHNIKTFLRLRLTRAPKEALAQRLGVCGFIAAQALMAAYEKENRDLFKLLERVPVDGYPFDYTEYLQEGLERLFDSGSFLVLERAMEDFLIQSLRPARRITLGPEPVVAYWLAKANEMDLVRMVILAKLAGFAAGQVRERLNLAYA